MNNITEWITWLKENSDIIESVTIEIKDKRKTYDFRQFCFDFIITSMICLTLKAIIVFSIGNTYINLY